MKSCTALRIRIRAKSHRVLEVKTEDGDTDFYCEGAREQQKQIQTMSKAIEGKATNNRASTSECGIEKPGPVFITILRMISES